MTEWLKQHPELTVVDTVFSQSSDQEFHCLTVTLSWRASKSLLIAHQPLLP
jgi:hypothetical protein